MKNHSFSSFCLDPSSFAIMLSRQDIIALRLTDEMLAQAIAYAERSLHYTFNRMNLASDTNRVLNIVTGRAMEAAFRFFLDEQHAAYDLRGVTHWTKSDRYDLRLGGRRCDVKGFLVRGHSHTSALQRDPGWLLDCCALVPADQVAAHTLDDNDVYIFPFMTARLGTNILAGQQVYLLHTFKPPPSKTTERKSLGALTVESRLRGKIRLRLGGQDVRGELLVEEIVLSPRQRVNTHNEFYTLLFAQTKDTPFGELVVTSAALPQDERIGMADWTNLWLYNGWVYLTGFMTKGEFRARAKKIPRLYRECKQYAVTKTENYMLPISELYPLDQLLSRDRASLKPTS